MAFNNYYGSQYSQSMYGQPMNSPQRFAPVDTQYPQFQQSMQMYQQPQQIPIGLNGRVVEDFNSIMANEVAMDGSISIFVKKDLSEICIKNWSSDGTIRTTSYKPITDSFDIDANKLSNGEEKLKFDLSETTREAFDKRFETIETKIDNLTKNLVPKSKVKKDGDSEC